MHGGREGLINVRSKTLERILTFKYAFTYIANIYLLKVNNRNTRKKCEICS